MQVCEAGLGVGLKMYEDIDLSSDSVCRPSKERGYVTISRSHQSVSPNVEVLDSSEDPEDLPLSYNRRSRDSGHQSNNDGSDNSTSGKYDRTKSKVAIVGYDGRSTQETTHSLLKILARCEYFDRRYRCRKSGGVMPIRDLLRKLSVVSGVALPRILSLRVQYVSWTQGTL